MPEYGYCESCGTSLPDDFDTGLCEFCCDNDDHNGILDGSTSADKLLGFHPVRPRDSIYYGIELEVDTVHNNHDHIHYLDLADDIRRAMPNHVIVKEDSSLEGYDDDTCGFEICSRPAGIPVHKEKFREFFNDLTLMSNLCSYNSPVSCGLHIHVSRAPLTQLQIGRMLVFIHAPENRSLIKCLAQRDSRTWGSYSAAKKLTDSKASALEEESRYTAVNLTNAKTIEFRLFRGTLNKSRFFADLEFVAALVEYTTPASRSLRDAVDSAAFLSWLSERRRKEYPLLVKYLINKGFLPEKKSKKVNQQELLLCV